MYATHPDWKVGVRFTPNLWGPLHDLPGSGAIIFSLRLVLLRYLDALVGSVYTTIVVTRTDHLYACDHLRLRPALGEVIVQEGQGEEAHGQGAVSDRHMVFRFEERRRVLSVLPWLVRALPDTVYAPEIVLGRYFAAAGLTVRKMSRIAFVRARDSSLTPNCAAQDAMHESHLRRLCEHWHLGKWMRRAGTRAQATRCRAGEDSS